MEKIFVSIRDPRQAKRVEHRLTGSVGQRGCAVLAGADEFVAIEEWVKEKQAWLQRYLALENDIFDEQIQKDHGRLEMRRCYVFDQLTCLPAPERWPDLASF